MAIHVRVDHMLAAVRGEPVPSRGTTSRRSSGRDSQVIVMPAAVVPPKLVDMVVTATKNDVLRTGKHVSKRLVGANARSPGRDGEVIVMPAAVVPPKLMDMVVDAQVIHVLSTLSRKYIPRYVPVNLRVGSACCDVEVIVMPAAVVPPKLVDMVVDAYVRNMVGALSFERVPCRVASGFCRSGDGGQIVVMPAPVVPPELVDIASREVYDVHVLGALASECVPDRATSRPDKDTSGTFQLDMMPAAVVAIVAPKLVEKLAKIDHMLSESLHKNRRNPARAACQVSGGSHWHLTVGCPLHCHC